MLTVESVASNEIKGSVLTVDDDPDVRHIIVCYLEDLGHTVYEANDGLEAMKIFHEKKPNLILIDMKMPVMGGIELIKILRKEASETPVIVISGQGDMDNTIEAMRLGALDYVLKPFTKPMLKEVVDKAFQKLRKMMKL